MSLYKYVSKEEHEYPELLYKFRKWSDQYQKRVLTDNELYLSAPKMFNDPYDTKIYPNFSIINTDEKREDYTKLFFIKNFSLYSDKTDDYELVGRLMDNFIKKLETGDHEIMYREQWDYIYDHHLGILSLSEIKNGLKPENNMPLWAMYTDEGKGFCISFKGKHLIEEFQAKFGGTGGNVNYTNEFPDIDPFEILGDQNFQFSEIAKKFTKAEKWAYENEYRLSALTPQVLGNDRKFIFSDDSVDKVILGYNISSDDKAEIIQLCTNKKWPIFQAKIKHNSFELEFEQVA